MKTQLSLRLLRLVLFCTAAALTLVTGTSAFAQTRAGSGQSRPLRLPPFIVEADPLTPPELNSDGTLTLPDGSVVTPPLRNSDGSITLPDGTVLTLPPRANSNGTLMLPDGTVVTPHADGTVTLPDGSVINPAPHPAPRAQGPAGGG